MDQVSYIEYLQLDEDLDFEYPSFADIEYYQDLCNLHDTARKYRCKYGLRVYKYLKLDKDNMENPDLKPKIHLVNTQFKAGIKKFPNRTLINRLTSIHTCPQYETEKVNKASKFLNRTISELHPESISSFKSPANWHLIGEPEVKFFKNIQQTKRLCSFTLSNQKISITYKISKSNTIEISFRINDSSPWGRLHRAIYQCFKYLTRLGSMKKTRVFRFFVSEKSTLMDKILNYISKNVSTFEIEMIFEKTSDVFSSISNQSILKRVDFLYLSSRTTDTEFKKGMKTSSQSGKKVLKLVVPEKSDNELNSPLRDCFKKTMRFESIKSFILRGPFNAACDYSDLAFLEKIVEMDNLSYIDIDTRDLTLKLDERSLHYRLNREYNREISLNKIIGKTRTLDNFGSLIIDGNRNLLEDSLREKFLNLLCEMRNPREFIINFANITLDINKRLLRLTLNKQADSKILGFCARETTLFNLHNLVIELHESSEFKKPLEEVLRHFGESPNLSSLTINANLGYIAFSEWLGLWERLIQIKNLSHLDITFQNLVINSKDQFLELHIVDIDAAKVIPAFLRRKRLFNPQILSVKLDERSRSVISLKEILLQIKALQNIQSLSINADFNFTEISDWPQCLKILYDMETLTNLSIKYDNLTIQTQTGVFKFLIDSENSVDLLPALQYKISPRTLVIDIRSAASLQEVFKTINSFKSLWNLSVCGDFNIEDISEWMKHMKMIGQMKDLMHLNINFNNISLQTDQQFARILISGKNDFNILSLFQDIKKTLCSQALTIDISEDVGLIISAEELLGKVEASRTISSLTINMKSSLIDDAEKIKFLRVLWLNESLEGISVHFGHFSVHRTKDNSVKVSISDMQSVKILGSIQELFQVGCIKAEFVYTFDSIELLNKLLCLGESFRNIKSINITASHTFEENPNGSAWLKTSEKLKDRMQLKILLGDCSVWTDRLGNIKRRKF